MTTYKTPGQHVHYIPYEGAEPQDGFIKSVAHDGDLFVVYHWGDDMANWRDYTAAKTPKELLFNGWYKDAFKRGGTTYIPNSK